MHKTISIHSFRGGTGKSNITANLGYILATHGYRVCVIDTDIQSPGIHIPLQIPDYKGKTLNDYLFGKANIEEATVDISEKLGLKPKSYYLIPSDIKTESITKILKEGYDMFLLAQAIKDLKNKLKVNFILIDTHPGLNEETLLSAALSDVFFVVMRPDEQDFQGSSVTIDIAKKLKVKNIFLIVNMVHPEYDLKQVKEAVEAKFNCPVAEVLPHTYNLNKFASKKLYCIENSKDVWPQKINNIASKLIND
ncbi:MAG TPA: MinD/ParA family protein [Victivallales bacterium]|nr:MinD/ParA family protein [Victivallales bacterium]